MNGNKQFVLIFKIFNKVIEEIARPHVCLNGSTRNDTDVTLDIEVALRTVSSSLIAVDASFGSL